MSKGTIPGYPDEMQEAEKKAKGFIYTLESMRWAFYLGYSANKNGTAEEMEAAWNNFVLSGSEKKAEIPAGTPFDPKTMRINDYLNRKEM